jgi:hypothetical protein
MQKCRRWASPGGQCGQFLLPVALGNPLGDCGVECGASAENYSPDQQSLFSFSHVFVGGDGRRNYFNKGEGKYESENKR